MTRPFRYVNQTADASVTLHLYRTINGTPRGDVRGPSSPHPDGRSNVVAMQSCLPLPIAFATAIRMANHKDAELVVSGDRTLWDVAWGTLAASQSL